MSVNIYCQNYTIHTLGYPYDKYSCDSYPNQYFNCFANCIKEMTINKLKRVPYSVFIDEPLNLKMISYLMVQNKTFSKLISSISSKCKKQCPTHSCLYSYCMTMARTTTSMDSVTKEKGSTIRVETTGQPNVFVNYHPSLPLLDFIIYILSSLGTWFGLVIISCDPFDFIHKFWQKLQGKQIRPKNEVIFSRRKVPNYPLSMQVQ